MARVPASSDAVAIAYSGGLDSSALLHLAQRRSKKTGTRLLALHVHHGLSTQADAWQAHCEQESERLGIAFASRRVRVADAATSGVEAAARSARYAALGAMCKEHDIGYLLTAHHQDDQAETVLLQLLRGSGVAGLSGMDQANRAEDLLGDATLIMARPLLGLTRQALAQFVADEGIDFIDDASNLDTRFARNALRQEVMPQLARFFPGFQQRLSRTARHAQAAQRLLIELAQQDHAVCIDGEALDIGRLKTLSHGRVDNLLRYWFGLRGVRMPSTAWLTELRDQLFDAKADAQLCVTHADCELHRHRGQVFITPRRMELDPEDRPEMALRWNGEASTHLPLFAGTLHFRPSVQGVSAEWLRAQTLQIGLRSGGEKLKPAANRSTRALKYHYQACNIPAWERTRLPVVKSGRQLLFAAGVGMDCHHFSNQEEDRVILDWEFDPE